MTTTSLQDPMMTMGRHEIKLILPLSPKIVIRNHPLSLFQSQLRPSFSPAFASHDPRTAKPEIPGC